MEKKVLVFSFAIYFIALCVTIADSIMNFSFDSAFLVLFSLVNLFCFYLVFQVRKLKTTYLVLSVTSLLQSFSFILFGLTYKLILGPDLSLYLVNSSDSLVGFSFKVFNVYSYFNYIGQDDTMGLGIHFLHLFLGIYFYLKYKHAEV